MSVDGGEYLRGGDECVGRRFGFDEDHGVFGIEAMVSYLRLDGVLQF